MSDPLDGAFARLDRAYLHLKELEERIEDFRKEHYDEIIAQQKASAREYGFEGSALFNRQPLFDVPVSLPIITGEVIYNLRSAMDYVVYELARRDSGSWRAGTQFIVEDRKFDPKNPNRGFDGRAKSCLAGLDQRHIAMIESYQPYKGVTWAKSLVDISNPDKHRRLTAVEGRFSAEVGTTIPFGTSFPGAPESDELTVTTGSSFGEPDVKIDLEYTIEVALPDGRPLVATLQYLASEVGKLLVEFKPEFERTSR
jgi:hypothetical protein